MIDKKPIEELIADCKKYLPAYPVITKTSDGTHFVHWGMSLRDYFAGQALAGLASKTYSTATNKALAKRSYALADAMLAEREK